MDKQKPDLPVNPNLLTIDENKKAKEKLIERVWEEYQQKRKNKYSKVIK